MFFGRADCCGNRRGGLAGSLDATEQGGCLSAGGHSGCQGGGQGGSQGGGQGGGSDSIRFTIAWRFGQKSMHFIFFLPCFIFAEQYFCLIDLIG